jgi:hypothetical protein
MSDMTDFETIVSSTTEDPAADFLAREQENLAGLEDDFNYDAKGPNESNGNGLIADDFGDLNGSDGEQFNGGLNGGLNSNYDLEQKESSSSPVSDKPEPEKIRVWREGQQLLLQQKDLEEDAKRDELKLSAKKELDEWYSRYTEQLEKSKLNNRTAEKEWIAERDVETPGLEWEKIAKMCDFNPKAVRNTKDTTRMRSILLQLKQSPPVKRTDE